MFCELDVSTWQGGSDMVAVPAGWGVVGEDGASRTVELPEDLTFEEARRRYLDATGASRSTRAEYQTSGRKWAEWLNVHRSCTPMHIREITAEVLDEWLTWVYEQAKSQGTNPGRSHNKARSNMRAVLNWAAKRRLIAAVPVFPDERDQREVAGHYFLTDDEVERVYLATYQLADPPRWKDPRSLALLWRLGIVLERNYGFDTQILWPYGNRDATVLCWHHVHLDRLPPGRVANIQNEYGWLAIRRQKTGALLVLPLDAVARAHLEVARPAVCNPETPIIGRAAARGRPCRILRKLIRWAGIPDKLDVETGAAVPWVLKDLRKTCATAHGPDVARLVLGHSSGSITERHYASSLPRLVEAFRSFPQPPALRGILDPEWRGPGELFAK